MDTNDTNLVNQLRDPDNREAWEHLVNEYLPRVIGHLRVRGFRIEDAEDIASATFTDLIKSLVAQSDAVNGDIEPYIFKIANSRSTDLIRKRNRKKVIPEGKLEPLDKISETRAEALLSGITSVIQKADVEEQAFWLSIVLERLKKVTRAEVWQSFVWRLKGMKNPEVAAILGVKTGTVSRNFGRLRTTVRISMQTLSEPRDISGHDGMPQQSGQPTFSATQPLFDDLFERICFVRDEIVTNIDKIGPQVKLLVVGSPRATPYCIDLADNYYIGRGMENDTVLNDGRVSDRHCRIFTRAGNWWIKDLESTNGVYRNGHKITGASLLHDGDVISITKFHNAIFLGREAATGSLSHAGSHATR